MLPLWDDLPRRRAPVITLLFIAANLVVFGYEVFLASQGGRVLETFLTAHSVVPERLLSGVRDPQQWQTLLTSMFLHGSVAHVAGNCWFLWIFGRSVESRLGPLLYPLFYVCAGGVAALTQVAFSMNSAVPMLGASGAISAVLGAYFILFPLAWVVTLVPWIVPLVPVPAFLFLLVWFALQAFNGAGSLVNDADVSGGVAWWAHAGGFVAGVVLVFWLKSMRWVSRR